MANHAAASRTASRRALTWSIPWLLTAVTGVVMAWVTARQLQASADLGALWTGGFDPSVLNRTGAADVALIWIDHEWWRGLTACFIHGGWLHWGVNMVSLHALWPWCLAAFGRRSALMALLSGGALASLASTYAAEGVVVVGVSGGLFALASMVVYERGEVCRDIRGQVVGAVGLCFFLGFALPLAWPTGPRLANIGHAVGWVVGGMWSIGISGRAGKAWWSWRFPVHLAITVATFGIAEFRNRTMFSEVCGVHLLQDGRVEEAIVLLDVAHGQRPQSAGRANALAYALSLSGQRLKQAAELSDTALASDPANSSYLDTRGWIHCRAGETEAGERSLRAALAAAGGADNTIAEHLRECGEDHSVRAE